MRVWIGNDHGGVQLKLSVTERLQAIGVDVYDIGTDSEEIVRYPYYARDVVAAVLSGDADRGILICSTGIGMSIIANKFPGVRAALCTTSYLAKMTRKHNDSNVLCLAGKTTGVAEAVEIAETWLRTEYEGGRHDISLGLIREAEDAMSNGSVWEPARRGL